jgi:hypothetical protein
VLPERIEVDGGYRRVHIVYGDYFNGRPELRDGQQRAIWRPRCYIAMLPYESWSTPPAGFAEGGNVLGYLDSLRSKGVTYTYAWWRDPKWGMSFWIGGSFLVIGLIWPTIVNLLAFGSFFRPKEEKGIDLSTVINRPLAASAQPAVSAEDVAAVEQMSTKLESKLESAAEPQSPPKEEPSARGLAVTQLAGDALEAVAVDQQDQDKAFGRAPGDFYPTERKGHVHCHDCGCELAAGQERCPQCGATISAGAEGQ